jgi:hypothetical protein
MFRHKRDGSAGLKTNTSNTCALQAHSNMIGIGLMGRIAWFDAKHEDGRQCYVTGQGCSELVPRYKRCGLQLPHMRAWRASCCVMFAPSSESCCRLAASPEIVLFCEALQRCPHQNEGLGLQVTVGIFTKMFSPNRGSRAMQNPKNSCSSRQLRVGASNQGASLQCITEPKAGTAGWPQHEYLQHLCPSSTRQHDKHWAHGQHCFV